MSFDPSQITPAELPFVTLGQRRELPSCQGIYFVLSAGQVVYVGKAKNLNSRWATHHRLQDLVGRPCVSIAWLQFDGADALLDEIERACIAYFAPLLNGAAVPPSTNGKLRRTFLLPNDLIAAIEAIAENERRTLSGQIEHFLISAIEEYEQGVRK